jgi:pimeloyl-ACP methyl ester carboxylesterase
MRTADPTGRSPAREVGREFPYGWAMPEVELHGHRLSYRLEGDGPPVLLVHGITSSSRTWSAIIDGLADRHTVIAPDLPGHGNSDKPRGDYSLGAYASSLRDLLVILGFPAATLVGHSLGGGIAMTFAYQFPERTQRLVLVSSGGLGEEVSIALRAATLPGAEFVLPVLFGGAGQRVITVGGSMLSRIGLRASANTRGLIEGIESLGDAPSRRAFVQTARSVLDSRGQRVDARGRLYLAEALPAMLVWGENDRIIPVRHARQALELVPHGRLVVFPKAGHFPFNDDPERFVEVLRDFVATTEPAELSEDELAALLRRGS